MIRSAGRYAVTWFLFFRHRRLAIIALHIATIVAANYLAFALRFEFQIDRKYFHQFTTYLPLLVVIRLILYLAEGLYQGLWRYSGIGDLVKIARSTLVGSLIFFILVRYVFGSTAYPRSIYILEGLLFLSISGGSRFFIRAYREIVRRHGSDRRVLVIGAGDAGEMIARDMKKNPASSFVPVGFIDDDPYKKGRSIHGYPIFGGRASLSEAVRKHRPDEILIAMPSAGRDVIKAVYDDCKGFHLPIRTLPALGDIVGGKVGVSEIRPLSLEDLLQRDPVDTGMEEIEPFLRGRRVLVTGAGGSIGAELCRQLVRSAPSAVILLERYENNLFEIDNELSAARPASTAVHAVVGDVTDTASLDEVFRRHLPEIVFHAAAHKHVPLMEHNALEAIRNNILGTERVLDAAARHGTASFVMISTDKAVNPANVMGATKRFAEQLTLASNGRSGLRCTVVRFGNVLGSSGSVVPIFREQVRRGGPVTVTHPEIKRYFMLIPEAVRLVLNAAAHGKGGDIFVLEMGGQIRIVELAENIIRLSGFRPYEDVQIVFTGLRPGEKLLEELFNENETILPTYHAQMRYALPKALPSREELEGRLREFARVVEEGRFADAAALLAAAVPEFSRKT